MNRVHRIDWLDCARLISALSVMAFHYMFSAPRDGIVPNDFGAVSALAKLGFLGVDFFFIVSGFVILFSAVNKPADAFVVSRLVRLYPAFICCMLLTLTVRLIAGQAITPVSVIANLSMVPEALRQPAVDGVYWSLAFEIVFYFVVFIIIFFGWARYLQQIVYGWISCQLLTYSFHIPFFSGFFSLFAGGAMLAFIYKDGWSWTRGAALSAAIGLSAANAVTRGGGHPIVLAGLTVTFFLVFIAFRRDLKIGGARTAGAITYPLYLLHAQIGFVLRPFFSSGWLWFVTCVLLFCCLGWIVSEWVERAPRKFWFALGDRTLGALVRIGVEKKGALIRYRYRVMK